MMLINLYASRVVLELLGIEDYGIYNVVGGVVTVFTFVSNAMMAATQRYLNVYIEQDDFDKTCEVFSSCVLIHFVVALLVVVLAEVFGLWFMNHKMTISVERMDAAFGTFQCAVITTAIIVFSLPYKAMIVAFEKMSAFAYVSILEAILKLAILYVVAVVIFDRLIMYSILYAIITGLITLSYIFYCRVYFKESKLRFKGLQMSLIKELVAFSGWNFLGNTASVCLTQGTNLLLNVFFCPAVNAAKGIAIQVQHSVDQFCTNFQMAQNPQIVKLYASNELSEMHGLVFRASRLSFYLVLIFAVPIIMRADSILTIWLGNPPEYTSVFVKYTMGFILVQSLANPLLTSSLATGDVKKIMLIIATLFCCIIPIGYVALSMGASPVAIFQIQLGLYVVAHVLRILIVSEQIHFSKMRYLKQVLLPVFYVCVLSFFLSYCIELLFLNTIFWTIVFCIASCFLTGLIVVCLGLSQEERVGVWKFVKGKIK
ncbi:MAG: lipopolysaccharide biosynthesis protein [Bacteroidales bacterium]|nr:lipopolysaccharide biosynthesis protein [Bacteroidales bacterium]